MKDLSLYEIYMEDSTDELYEEMEKFLESYQPYLEAKEGVYKDNYYLRDHLQIPYVQKVLANSKNRDALSEFVNKFLDDHVDQLSTSGPVHIFTFSEKEVSFLYDMFSINDETLLKLYDGLIQETYYGKVSAFFTGWIKHAPHKLLITSMLIEGLQKGYDDVVMCCEYIWAFNEYPIVYRHYWSIGVKEDVMNYTIEHLGSKFKITNMKNLQELIYYHAHKSVTTNRDKLIEGLDNAYLDFMHRMRTQFNNNFHNIANAYYANDKLGLTLHTKDSQFDDGSLSEQEGHATNMARAIDTTINKLSTSGVEKSIVKIVSDGSDIDQNNLTAYINQIFATKGNKLNLFIENIITAYFNRNPTNTSLGTTEFLNFGLALYRSIGTSKDPIYQSIKQILQNWITDIVDLRSTYKSDSTISNYTRAIFNYFVFAIFYVHK